MTNELGCAEKHGTRVLGHASLGTKDRVWIHWPAEFGHAYEILGKKLLTANTHLPDECIPCCRDGLGPSAVQIHEQGHQLGREGSCQEADGRNTQGWQQDVVQKGYPGGTKRADDHKSLQAKCAAFRTAALPFKELKRVA